MRVRKIAYAETTRRHARVMRPASKVPGISKTLSSRTPGARKSLANDGVLFAVSGYILRASLGWPLRGHSIYVGGRGSVISNKGNLGKQYKAKYKGIIKSI